MSAVKEKGACPCGYFRLKDRGGSSDALVQIFIAKLKFFKIIECSHKSNFLHSYADVFKGNP